MLVVSILAHAVQVSQLVAELLFSFHNGLQLDKDGGGHMEEVVLGIQLLVLFSQALAPLTKFVDSLLHLASLEVLQALPSSRGVVVISASVVVVTLQLQKLDLKGIIFVASLSVLSFLCSQLALKPLDLVRCLFLVKLGLVHVTLQVFLLKRSLLVDGEFIDVHLEFHAELHDLLILGDDLVLSLLQFKISVPNLGLIVLKFDLERVVGVLHVSHLSGVRVLETRHVRLKLLNQVLLVPQLILNHVKLLNVLLLGSVVLGGYLQFDILFLECLDLFMQVVKLGFIFLDFVFIFGDPFLVLGSKLSLVLLKLLNLPLPLVVSLALKQLNLSLQLLNSVIFLLELHIDHSLVVIVGNETAFIAANRCDQVL